MSTTILNDDETLAKIRLEFHVYLRSLKGAAFTVKQKALVANLESILDDKAVDVKTKLSNFKAQLEIILPTINMKEDSPFTSFIKRVLNILGLNRMLSWTFFVPKTLETPESINHYAKMMADLDELQAKVVDIKADDIKADISDHKKCLSDFQQELRATEARAAEIKKLISDLQQELRATEARVAEIKDLTREKANEASLKSLIMDKYSLLESEVEVACYPDTTKVSLRAGQWTQTMVDLVKISFDLIQSRYQMSIEYGHEPGELFVSFGPPPVRITFPTEHYKDVLDFIRLSEGVDLSSYFEHGVVYRC